MEAYIELHSIAEEIKQLLGKMLVIAKEQVLLAQQLDVENDLDDQIIACFQKRQDLMGKINQSRDRLSIGEKVLALKPDDSDRSQNNPEEKSIREYMIKKQEILNIIHAIQVVDQEGQIMVKDKSRETSRKMNSARKNRIAYDAYMQSDSCSEGWFFDKKK